MEQTAMMKKKLWYVYSHSDNIGMTASKDQAFKMLEGFAKRKWSKTIDSVSADKITLGSYEAKLEVIK